MASKNNSNFVRFIFLSFVLIILLINKLPSRSYLNMAGFINEFQETEISYKAMKENFIMKQYYEARKKDLLIQIESIKHYYLLQEEIITLINNHCIINNIIIENIVFINDDVDVYNHDEYEEKSPLRVMRVVIEFKCGYDDLLLFIDEVKNDSIEIAVLNMRIINWNNDIVNVAMDLNFYSINEVDIL